MTEDDLCHASATDLLKLFKARKLKPSELVHSLHKRSAKLNAKINCFADQYWDEAFEEAKRADARYAKRDAKLRKLEGLPVLVKDAQRVAGKRTTHGSLIFEQSVDEASDPMIERLQKAGAIIVARTTTPEFCLSGATHSRLWGITRNPWNVDYGPGGSSGGSAAALAAGFAPLATGTDIGGSIRIPAACCGVVGFKPPHGRNPDGAPSNFDRYNHCGPLTRSVADAALMQSVTAGPHAADHDSLRSRVKLPTKAASLKGIKIAYSVDFGYVNVDEDVRRNTLLAVDHFRDLGAIVEEVDLGWTAALEADCQHWFNTMHFGRQTIWHQTDKAHLMTDYALKFADHAKRASTIDDVHRPWARAHEMYQSLGPVLAKHAVLLCPTNNLPAIKAEHDPWDRNFTINGIKSDPEYGWVMTHHFNMLHNCPVMSVPSGYAKTGVPTGLQIVGRSFDDAAVFKIALAYEKTVGGWFGTKKQRPRLG